MTSAPNSASTQEPSPWQDYKRRRRVFFAILLSYIPGVFTLSRPLTRLFHSSIPFYVVAGAWMLAYVVSYFFMCSFPCPRCHRAFFLAAWPGRPGAQARRVRDPR
jgi:hypothetical protein